MPASGSRPILVPLIVACAMFMQNLDCKAIAHAETDASTGGC
jgi:hypothetical protein